METKRMSLVYEETLIELENAVNNALKINDKLRTRYEDLPLSVKEKIRMVEGDLLMILNRIPHVKF